MYISTETDAQSTHSNASSANGLILLPSLAEKDGGTSLEIFMFTSTMWIPPADGLKLSVCPVSAPGSQSHQLMSPGHMNLESTAPFQLLVQTLHSLSTPHLSHALSLSHTHTWS